MDQKQLNIVLTVAQWNVVMEGVTAMAYVKVADIVPIMRMQADYQLKALMAAEQPKQSVENPAE